ncbi:hypothetical protein DMUE_0935 [Dictyocoela muelleri]|nr:hypothetical protein DMUE_0935 [Dictyocoela muelleri]
MFVMYIPLFFILFISLIIYKYISSINTYNTVNPTDLNLMKILNSEHNSEIQVSFLKNCKNYDLFILRKLKNNDIKMYKKNCNPGKQDNRFYMVDGIFTLNNGDDYSNLDQIDDFDAFKFITGTINAVFLLKKLLNEPCLDKLIERSLNNKYSSKYLIENYLIISIFCLAFLERDDKNLGFHVQKYGITIFLYENCENSTERFFEIYDFKSNEFKALWILSTIFEGKKYSILNDYHNRSDINLKKNYRSNDSSKNLHQLDEYGQIPYRHPNYSENDNQSDDHSENGCLTQ